MAGQHSTATATATERRPAPAGSRGVAREADPIVTFDDETPVVDWSPPSERRRRSGRLRRLLRKPARKARRAWREARIRRASRRDAARRLPLRQRVRAWWIRRERRHRRDALAGLAPEPGAGLPARSRRLATLLLVVAVALLVVAVLVT
ncbi:MAG: hypothetical protein AAF567_26595 [Actinomycetota bacterium]